MEVTVAGMSMVSSLEQPSAKPWAISSKSAGKRISVKLLQSVKMLSVKNEGFFETLNNKISKYELKS